jgi:C_GCAxxG_C_C family probable redox protein
MSFEEEAGLFFEQSYNCAQSVFAPFAKKLGLDVDAALKIATPFGGGISHTGQICGALSGAVMAIGLAKGTADNDEAAKNACSELAEEFLKRFAEMHGDLTCPGLLGLDIGDPEQSELADKENLFSTLCPVFVRDAAKLAAEMLELQG